MILLIHSYNVAKSAVSVQISKWFGGDWYKRFQIIGDGGQQRHLHANNSALFAIAVACEFLFVGAVGSYLFDESQMRVHLLRCLQANNMTVFPKQKIVNVD